MPDLHRFIRSADSRTRHPELYTAPNQPSAEDEVSDLLQSFIYALKPDYVLETGTSEGHTSIKLAAAMHFVGVGHVDTVEKQPQRYEMAKKNVIAANDSVGTPLPIHLHLSPDGWEGWKPPKGRMYDMAFFDATRDRRDEEYEYFKPYLSPGAMLFFHDSGDNHPSERTWAIDLPKIFVPTPRGLLIMQHPWEGD